MMIEKVLISFLFLVTNFTVYSLMQARAKNSYRLLFLGSVMIAFFLIPIQTDVVVFQTMPKSTFNGLLFFSLALPIFRTLSKVQLLIFGKKIDESFKPGYSKIKPAMEFMFFKLIFAMVFVYQLYVVWDEAASFRKSLELP